MLANKIIKIIKNNNKVIKIMKNNVCESYRTITVKYNNGNRIIKITKKDVRLYGYFNCGYCRSFWTSGCSWLNKGQECKKCIRTIYPFDKKDLKKNKISENQNKPHLSSLCEKCRELGFSCERFSN